VTDDPEIAATMTTHDPRKVVDTLRDHLASHEKRLSFLFGAGTSAAAQTLPGPDGKTRALIPTVVGLTQGCESAVRALGSGQAAAWDLLEAECAAAKTPSNIEAILSRIRMKIDAMDDSDKMLGVNKDTLREIENTIARTIAKLVQPDDTTIPPQLPHHSLAKWILNTQRRYPIEIFTTNYDLLFERALEDERVPIFDGFVGVLSSFFFPDSLNRAETSPGSNWTRVWKIHGSVNWQWKDVGGVRRIVRTQPVSTGEMILPSHYKYDESRKQPYMTLLDRLQHVLDQEDSLLICIGYSFSDEHINSVVFDALGARPRVHVYGLQFAEPGTDSHVAKAAERLKNLLVLGPDTGIIGGQRFPWKLSEEFDVGDYLGIAFKTTKAKKGELGYLSGALQLGDFVAFSRSLTMLTAR
jgi:hypothetical protein